MYEDKHLTLLKALEIIKRRKAKSTIEFPVFFASGFTPLHLLSFTQAYLQASSPEETIIIKSGLFNDLFGMYSLIENTTGTVIENTTTLISD